MNTVNIEAIIYSYYIKYSRLNELFRYTPIINNHVDIYIDLYDLYKKTIYTKWTVDPNKKFIYVSGAINLVAHIRGLFRSKGVDTTFYLIYGNYDESSLMQNYDYRIQDILQVQSQIEHELSLLKIICAYIPKAYFIRKHVPFAVASAVIMDKYHNSRVFITKDKYAYQLVAYNNILYRPRKTNGEDVSYVVHKGNAMQAYFDKINSPATIKLMNTINPELLGLIISLTTNDIPSKKKIINSVQCIKLITDSIASGRIINGYNSDTDYLYEVLSLSRYVSNYDFKSIFETFDLNYSSTKYSLTPEGKDFSWIIDLQDPEAIKDINNRYFMANPLDLDNL